MSGPTKEKNHRNMRMIKLGKFAACFGAGVMLAKVGMNARVTDQLRIQEPVIPANNPEKGAAAGCAADNIQEPADPYSSGRKVITLTARTILWISAVWSFLFTLYAWIGVFQAPESQVPAHLLMGLLLPFLVYALLWEMRRTEPGHAWIDRALRPLAFMAGFAVVYAFNLSQLTGSDHEMSTAFGLLGVGLFMAAASYPVLFACRAQLDYYERKTQK